MKNIIASGDLEKPKTHISQTTTTKLQKQHQANAPKKRQLVCQQMYVYLIRTPLDWHSGLHDQFPFN